jgi:hypothetical protein
MLIQNVSSDLLSGPVLESLEHSGEKCRCPACPAVPGQKVRSETGPLKGTRSAMVEAAPLNPNREFNWLVQTPHAA